MKRFTEHCTAVAVTPGPEPVFLSAWHCFEHYRSTIQPITVMSDEAPSPVTLRLVDSGGSMREDWALLQASRPAASATWIPVSPEPARSGQSVTAAGFAPIESQTDSERTQRLLMAHLPALSPMRGHIHSRLIVWPDKGHLAALSSAGRKAVALSY